MWVVRDFSLKMEDANGNPINADQYLEKCLAELDGDNEMIEKKNKLRKRIKTFFPNRNCTVMVTPADTATALQNLSQTPI
jgi:hypothetical protein